MAASLSLSYQPLTGMVQVRRGDGTSDGDWTSLRLAWPEAIIVGDSQVDIELFSFLEHVGWLVDWAHADVDWDPELLAIVEQNFHQRDRVQQILLGEGAGHIDAGVDLAESSRWVGDLKPFQLRDLSKLAALENGANFSVPGAGKTRTTLALYELARLKGYVTQLLVVAPLPAHETWLEETRVCFQGVPMIQVLTVGPPSLACEIAVINYERLPNAGGTLSAWCAQAPTMVVLDEAHRVKRGPLGVWGSAALRLAPAAARRDVLTGTPAPHGLNDLATLMQFLWLGQARRIISAVSSAPNLKDASRALRPIFARTTKHELHLPPMTLNIRRVEALPLHRDLYQALCGLYAGQFALGPRDLIGIGRVVMYLLMAATNPAILQAGSDRRDALEYDVPPIDVPSGTTLSELLNDLPYYEAPAKYAELAKIVEANAGRNRKTLVWSTFVRNIETLSALLAAFKPAVVHGGAPDRADEIRRFRQNPACFVLLANPAAIGEGISLHESCHDAVYLDRDFAAGKYMQSVDRIHRLGLPPDADVRVTLLVTPGTIDEVVEARVAAKIAYMGALLDDDAVNALSDPEDEEAAVYGLSADDVADVLAHLRM